MEVEVEEGVDRVYQVWVQVLRPHVVAAAVAAVAAVVVAD